MAFTLSDSPTVIDLDDYHFENYAIIPEYTINYDVVEITSRFPYRYYHFQDGGLDGIMTYFEKFLEFRGFTISDYSAWGEIFNSAGDRVGSWGVDGFDESDAAIYEVLPIVKHLDEFAELKFKK